MTTVKVFAPAKINLALHITGRREDGYHDLDTLVAFADIGDFVTIKHATRIAEQPIFEVAGPESGELTEGPDNLVMRAVDMMLEDLAPFVRLEKHLPVASGIGGGSADAAAAIRGMYRARNMKIDDPASSQNAISMSAKLGADVPMCLRSETARARGIGDLLEAVELQNMYAVLVNPRQQVSTAQVFRQLKTVDNPGLGWPPPKQSVRAFCGWLRDQRNDLETPAIKVAPVIGDVLKAISQQSGVLLSRMSGSGATCFGIFTDQGLAEIAAKSIRQAEQSWWVHDVVLGDMSELALAQVS